MHHTHHNGICQKRNALGAPQYQEQVWQSKARVLWNGAAKLQYLRIDNI
jgi:hypothetical protein